jgi:hypothetical protein
MFNIAKMTASAIEAINRFSVDHKDETFYAFAIDADMLCLNSEEKFSTTLLKYQASSPEHYASEMAITELKNNTGDWEYQGFHQLDQLNGFEYSLYQNHYDEPSAESDYALAMTALIAAITASGVISTLKTTDGFYATWVDHNY